ncbi:MAG: carboxymuconolactone decarboxylase family protein [Thermoanaerobacterales bacterium]|nr:carboxymuconolactone decarboxylase family protein [Thermoanaerobacterales bacterium]
MSEKPSVEQILRKMEQQLGAEPLPMKLLAQLSPETVYDHVAMRQHVDTRPSIPAKGKMLMFVATAAALGSEFCTRTYARLALKAGASAEEITEAPGRSAVRQSVNGLGDGRPGHGAFGRGQEGGRFR